MGKNPQPIGSLLESVFAGMGMSLDGPEMVLRVRWPEAIGAGYASGTVVDRLDEKGCLHIRVEYNSALANELWMRQEDVRERLNRFLGKEIIKSIQVKGRRFDAV